MFRSVIQKNLLRLLLITALLACAVGGSTAQTANTESLLYSAGSPIPANRVKAIYAAELRKALRDIKAAIPAMNMVHFFVEVGTSSPSDWVAILDVCQSEGFRAAFGFAEPKDDGSGLYRGYRPVLSNGTWQMETWVSSSRAGSVSLTRPSMRCSR